MARKSVDLTTLAGWEALPANTYNITIVAKANGFKDSEPSAAVQVEKAAAAYTDCLTFTGENGQNFTLKATYKEWDGVLEYSTDHNTWTTLSAAGVEMSSVNGKLYLRGSGNTTFYSYNGAQFVLSERTGCSGNIQTLLDYENPPTNIPADNCYYSMFNGCTGLTTAPELPATTLKTYCYSKMFRGCTGLTTAPKLPATTLTSNCYYSMFSGCTGLTTAPKLPATTLASYCYYYMFSGCTSLKVSSTKTGEYQKEWRIPTSGTIASEETFWSTGMLENTGGTFTSNPSINTTYYVENAPV